MSSAQSAADRRDLLYPELYTKLCTKLCTKLYPKLCPSSAQIACRMGKAGGSRCCE
jgi:hypothetical protein